MVEYVIGLFLHPLKMGKKQVFQGGIEREHFQRFSDGFRGNEG